MDADLTQEVFLEIFRKAHLFRSPGGSISLAAERERDVLVIAVANTGRGIAPEMLANVFDLFTQASTDEGGIGVGLAVVRGLVERHGGTVSVRSAGIGKGTEFIVRLSVASSAV